jgi:hypothetical protein
MRDGCAPCSYNFFAYDILISTRGSWACTEAYSSLGAADRTQIPQLYGMLVYHAPELGFLAPARGQRLRVRTAMAQGQLDRQRRGHAYQSYLGEWLLGDLDRVLRVRNTH